MQIQQTNALSLQSTNCIGMHPAFLPDLGVSLVSLDFRNWLGGSIARVSGRDGTPSTSQTRSRIMIVDDEKDISAIFKSGLTRNGFEVDIFNEPYDALSHYKADYYDLLLLDVRMPGLPGFELFREILRIDSTAKACFISAFEVHRDELAKYLPGGDEGCIVKKPVSLKDLVRIVKEEISD